MLCFTWSRRSIENKKIKRKNQEKKRERRTKKIKIRINFFVFSYFNFSERKKTCYQEKQNNLVLLQQLLKRIHFQQKYSYRFLQDRNEIYWYLQHIPCYRLLQYQQWNSLLLNHLQRVPKVLGINQDNHKQKH